MTLKNTSSINKIKLHFNKFWSFYVFLLPIVIFALLFKYFPFVGIIGAFKDIKIMRGSGGFDTIFKGDNVGFSNFIRFFDNPLVFRAFRNTLLISFYKILFLFPLPIFIAILVNEITRSKFKKTAQTIMYLPHFLSWVIVSALFMQFFGAYGFINTFLKSNHVITKSIQFFGSDATFRPMVVFSAGWKETGWNTVVYLAAITGIDPTLYEAARVDGASKFQSSIHITLPSIASTIAMLFILRIGDVLNAGFEQIFNMISDTTRETGEIIDYYVYKLSLGAQGGADWGFGIAVGLVNSVLSFIILMVGNALSRKFFKKGLW
jgi:putative aldouronate transport system permease protein